MIALAADNTNGIAPLYVSGAITCDPGAWLHDETYSTIGPETIAVGDSRGLVPGCEISSWEDGRYAFIVATDEMHAAGKDISCTGAITSGLVGDMPLSNSADALVMGCSWINGTRNGGFIQGSYTFNTFVKGPDAYPFTLTGN